MERIDVLALYTDGKVSPMAYKLNGKEYKIKEVTAYYSYDEGTEKVFHIYASDQEDNVRELVYWPDKQVWAIK